MANASLRLIGEKSALLSFLFHGLFLDEDEFSAGIVDPQQGITVEMFRSFIAHFKNQSYQFISPADIPQGLQPEGKYLLITFDDGYYNNVRALPVLEEFDVPAVFFISSDHVRQGKAYWWDVVFREFGKRGKTKDEIRQAQNDYKRLQTGSVESLLKAQFGKESLRPVGDLDRPFNASELRAFADHRLVVLGNHTKDHAILTNYSAAEIAEQIQGAQDAIREMTGKLPEIIAYPNGEYSEDIAHMARSAGLRLGMVVQAGKNKLSVRGLAKEAMRIKRFIIWGDCGIDSQCRASRSDVSLYRTLKQIRFRTRPGFSY
jgi:peptidoglycan/xylan/chitin deacetylase (PgdA/CDA1 family)